MEALGNSLVSLVTYFNLAKLHRMPPLTHNFYEVYPLPSNIERRRFNVRRTPFIIGSHILLHCP